jgi:hypothetical protein
MNGFFRFGIGVVLPAAVPASAQQSAEQVQATRFSRRSSPQDVGGHGQAPPIVKYVEGLSSDGGVPAANITKLSKAGTVGMLLRT